MLSETNRHSRDDSRVKEIFSNQKGTNESGSKNKATITDTKPEIEITYQIYTTI